MSPSDMNPEHGNIRSPVLRRRRLSATLIHSIGLLGAGWLLAGIPGLLTGMMVFGLWWGLRPPSTILWGGSVALLAMAPLSVFVQGLPHTPVVGSGFGARHLIAHHLVIASLVLAGFAGLAEFFGMHHPRSSLDRNAQRPTRNAD